MIGGTPQMGSIAMSATIKLRMDDQTNVSYAMAQATSKTQTEALLSVGVRNDIKTR